MRKGHICGELDAWKMIISFCERSPRVLWAYTFKDVYLISVRSSHTRAIKLKKKIKEREHEKRRKRKQTTSPALGVESSESDSIPWVRL